ncbi:glycosyltransferase family 2 protein [Flavobacterium pallidum]|uniref:Glycosyl transferase n=1 Tax=Flavobacterium pallidum TaxID=2172098 RepID=A0A2S1SED8_9FLAO|nr:glycosyltransferase [Flavobacterium pallidum]AWI24749.1 glycosyl transferase [Flavobacterium pallidum]
MIAVYVILMLYCAMIFSLVYGFSRVKPFVFEKVSQKTKFSIVVPFRNEKENLPALLESLSTLDYPEDLYEVILIDDDSEDGFSPKVPGFRVVQNIRVSASPKKDAILTAIAIAKHEWIVTTDADCIVPQKWLATIDAFVQKHSCEMVAGAVTYNLNGAFLQHFQQSDLAALQGVTMGCFGLGKPFMCNGANFAYTRDIFTKLEGFNGNDKHAGGDDVFLLQKAIAAFPEKVGYLKSAFHIVATKPVETFSGLFYQRVRWASKTASYQSVFGKLIGILALLGNMAWIAGLVLLLMDLNQPLLLTLLLLKWLSDGWLITKTNQFLGNRTRYYLLSAISYPFFSTVVALYSLIGKYEWKGRHF